MYYISAHSCDRVLPDRKTKLGSRLKCPTPRYANVAQSVERIHGKDEVHRILLINLMRGLNNFTKNCFLLYVDFGGDFLVALRAEI